MAMNECAVCCETYNKSLHKEVICPFGDCNYSCCKTCVRTYLLDTTALPHCMNCKKSLEDKFLVDNLNRSFCDKEYKEHRRTLLMERELSKLPETMVVAERYKRAAVELKKAEDMNAEITKQTEIIKQLKIEQQVIMTNAFEIRTGITKSKEVERKKFIMPCTNSDCRGFLSTQYKCELCDMFTCPDCHELIGYTKTEGHTCNPDNVASAELIKKETKGCPTCGVRISKINGCNQMWCTECKVAFDYRTGKIDNGTVHNPYYYEHQAQLNQGQAIRNPGDVICGGLTLFADISRQVYPLMKSALVKEDYDNMIKLFNNIHRLIAHVTYVELPQVRNVAREADDNEKLRVDYILSKITKDDIGKIVYQRDIQYKKNLELLHIYELFSVVGIETFNSLYTDARRVRANKTGYEKYMETLQTKMDSMNDIRKYCNELFQKISNTYNRSAPYYNSNWELGKKKYSIMKA